MKILIITNHSYMLYRFRKELIQALHQDHEIVLSMPFVGHETDFMKMGIRCIQTDFERREIHATDEIRLFFTYAKQILTERPDLVLTYSIKPNIYAGLICRFLGVPYCATVQGLGTAFQMEKFHSYVTFLYRMALRKAKVVFFENISNADIFADKGILPTTKQTILNGAGINLTEYPCTDYPKHDTFRFLYLGRIMHEKGVDELFACAKELYAKHGKKFILDIVGFFDYEDYTDKIRELESMGIAQYHGFQTDPRPYYAQADCVIVPSYHEGMSNVLLEAAAMGRPLIATDIPGCRETIVPSQSGLLCQVRDVTSLFHAMDQMMQLSPDERAEMGLKGRRHMEDKFDRQSVVQKILNTLPLK